MSFEIEETLPMLNTRYGLASKIRKRESYHQQIVHGARLDGKYFSHMSKQFHHHTVVYVSNSTLRQRAITDYTCGKHISSLPRFGTSGIFLSRQPRITWLIRKGAIISNSVSLSLSQKARIISAKARHKDQLRQESS